MASPTQRTNGLQIKQTLGGSAGQGSLACCSARSHKELDTSERLNNNIREVQELIKSCLML